MAKTEDDVPRYPPPTKPGPYKFRCKECNKLRETVLEGEDLNDGCRDGTLICWTCLTAETKRKGPALTVEEVIAAYDAVERDPKAWKN